MRYGSDTSALFNLKWNLRKEVIAQKRLLKSGFLDWKFTFYQRFWVKIQKGSYLPASPQKRDTAEMRTF